MWIGWWGLLSGMECGEGGRVCLVVWHVDRVVVFAQWYGVGRGW